MLLYSQEKLVGGSGQNKKATCDRQLQKALIIFGENKEWCNVGNAHMNILPWLIIGREKTTTAHFREREKAIQLVKTANGRREGVMQAYALYLFKEREEEETFGEGPLTTPEGSPKGEETERGKERGKMTRREHCGARSGRRESCGGQNTEKGRCHEAVMQLPGKEELYKL
eukprot:4047276-Heterocapsa_arctica.AAC.1